MSSHQQPILSTDCSKLSSSPTSVPHARLIFLADQPRFALRMSREILALLDPTAAPETFAPVFHRTLQTISLAWECTRDVLSSTAAASAGTEDDVVPDHEIARAIAKAGEMQQGGTSEAAVEDAVEAGPVYQVILSWAWRAVKESRSVLAPLASSASEADLDLALVFPVRCSLPSSFVLSTSRQRPSRLPSGRIRNCNRAVRCSSLCCPRSATREHSCTSTQIMPSSSTPSFATRPQRTARHERFPRPGWT